MADKCLVHNSMECGPCTVPDKELETLKATLAQMRQGLEIFKGLECRCDPEVGMVPCEACFVQNILDKTTDIAAWHKAQILRAKAEGLERGIKIHNYRDIIPGERGPLRIMVQEIAALRKEADDLEVK